MRELGTGCIPPPSEWFRQVSTDKGMRSDFLNVHITFTFRCEEPFDHLDSTLTGPCLALQFVLSSDEALKSDAGSHQLYGVQMVMMPCEYITCLLACALRKEEWMQSRVIHAVSHNPLPFCQ